MKTLNEIPRQNPFKVPENYFEEANRRIIASAADTSNVVAKTGLYRRLRPYLIAAASIALIAVLSYTAARILIPGTSEPAIPELSAEEFSSSYIDYIDVRTLEDGTDPAALSDEIPMLSKPEIIDCLMLENIDLNDIYELL
ncbi:MAG: hypothetical protein ABSA76_04285 [Bacteroidales bacterium]